MCMHISILILNHVSFILVKKKKLHGFSLQANYTDRHMSKLVPTFADRGCCVANQWIPTAVNLDLLKLYIGNHS
jgi:hypothetical protein